MKIKDAIRRSIASNIKRARIESGMTQAIAAEKLNITAQAISNYERGVNGIENSLLLRMCEIYNTNLNAIMGEELGDESSSSLTSRDQKDIAKSLEQMMSQLEDSSDLMFDGDPMSDEARESIRQALQMGLEIAKVKNKERFTPHKYRKG